MTIRGMKTGFRVDVSKCINGKVHRFRKTVETREEAKKVEAYAKAAFAEGVTGEELKAKFNHGSGVVQERTMGDLLQLTIDKRWFDNKVSQARNARMVIEAIGEDTPISCIDKAMVLDILDYWKDMGNSDSTLNRKLSAVMTMIEEGIEANWLPEEAKPRIKRKSETKGNPCWLTTQQTATLIGVVRSIGKGAHADVYEFCVNTGLRISEALSLRVGDRVDNVLTLTMASSLTKKHNRNIPLTSKALEIFQRLESGKNVGERLFSVNYESCRQVWDRYVRPAFGWVVGDNYSIHILRHTFASLALQQGVSLEELQKWLGHENISTTLRYAKMTGEHLQKSVSKIEAALAVA
ncbi:TPA: tyrosine-type recombinase/integrase [Photobacterium damselae]